MKVILYSLLSFSIMYAFSANAQQFSPTAGVPCVNCSPTNYSKVHSPAISDVWGPHINIGNDKWNIPGFLLPVPPSSYSQGLPSNGGKNSFVTLKTSEGVYDDRLFINVGGFTIGKVYIFRYSVLSASIFYEAGNMSPYGQSAKMEIFTAGQNPTLIKEQVTDFDASNHNKWITRVISFTATATTLQFKLTGSTSGQSAGYINFDIDKYPFDCQLASNQVQLVSASSKYNTIFPGDKLDLTTVPVLGGAPQGAELVWKTGPNSSDVTLTPQEAASVSISNQNPANVKPYYAFFYAKDFNCYNVPVSSAALEFNYIPTQVTLKPGSSSVTVSCTEPTTDLTKLVDDPIGPVVWFTTSDHQGAPFQTPQQAPAGDYYAFYIDVSKGGFSLKSGTPSNAHVKVENPIIPGTPDLGPAVSINSLIFVPSASKDFVVRMQNILAGNSGCSVYFRISKLQAFTISYDTQAGQSNVDGGIFNNNDNWVFTEDDNFITVTSKYGIPANGYSDIGFKITRNANTPVNTSQNLTVSIPLAGGGGENNTANNISIITVKTSN